MVLVLFVVMLLNLKVENPRPIGKLYFSLGVIAALGFLVILLPMLFVLFSQVPDQIQPLVGGAKEIGRLLYTEYLFPFEISSVLLFVAISGAIMVAKRSYAVTGIVPESSSDKTKEVIQ